ncbi:hypothetical protein DFH06DRAFT_1422389 [Mycena polygramma]|nr:hypothetical protein DFH06DRAFT_1422389 [Mycena polygramma]
MGVTGAQKKAIEEVLAALLAATGSPRKRQLAGMFLELVDRDDWPEYYEVIPEPRCLSNIQTMLEKNRYKDPLDAYTDLSLVFLNALFYNEPDSQIAMDAKTLKNLLESEWKSKALPIPRESPPPSSAQKVHEPPETKKKPPSTQPAPAVKPSPPIAAPTPIVPQPTFVYSKPTPITPIDPPAPEYSESESESEDEDDMYDPPLNAPTDIQIVRQLERGLPRYTPLLGTDGGWMADVKHERHLEIVQAIKAYRDDANVKLSTALDGVPEDKLAISFRLLESRSRSKTFYTSSRPFDSDVARMFESGRRYYLQRGSGVAGVGGEEWGRVVTLQRIAHAFTSTNAPPLPLTQPLALPSPPRVARANALESVPHKGFVLRAGDYVHVISGAEADGENLGMGLGHSGRPLIGRVVGCWRDDAGEGGVTVRWYLRADEISHLMPPAHGPIEGEIVQTDKTTHHFLPDVIERVGCQHTSLAARGRPRAPAWYPGWPLYVCGRRYDAARTAVRRIPRAEWLNDHGSGSSPIDASLDLFERPVRLGTQPTPQQRVLVDRSVVSAGGMAVSATEKLAPETARRFERDAATGEVLWFPGPPMHVARAPPPRHRLEYLHFLARKYRPELAVVKAKPEPDAEKPVVNGNGKSNGNGNRMVEGETDDSMGSDDVRAQSAEPDSRAEKEPDGDGDVEMSGGPPAKRRKVEDAPERYISASERIREVLARGAALEVA